MNPIRSYMYILNQARNTVIQGKDFVICNL